MVNCRPVERGLTHDTERLERICGWPLEAARHSEELHRPRRRFRSRPRRHRRRHPLSARLDPARDKAKASSRPRRSMDLHVTEPVPTPSRFRHVEIRRPAHGRHPHTSHFVTWRSADEPTASTHLPAISSRGDPPTSSDGRCGPAEVPGSAGRWARLSTQGPLGTGGDVRRRRRRQCQKPRRECNSARRSEIGTRVCAVVSRSRMVTAPSSSDSKSTVTQSGVPLSSCRRYRRPMA